MMVYGKKHITKTAGWLGVWLAVALMLLAQVAHAESKEMRALHPHELRVGWGDPLFETVAFHPSMHRDYTFVHPGFVYQERQNYHYSGHVVAEYQYRPNKWFGVGVQADYSQFTWDDLTYEGGSNVPTEEVHQMCYNVAVMPTLRLTYLHHYWVDLYSEIGLGLLLNGGTEKNDKGRTMEAGLAADVAVLGCSVGTNRFFGALEVGGLFGLQSLDRCYLIGARLVTASIGVRF